MALSMVVAMPSGVNATYHKISTGIVDFVATKTTLNMESFLDQAARESGKAPLSGSSLTIDGLPSFTGDPRPWAYAQFKARPEWADAADA